MVVVEWFDQWGVFLCETKGTSTEECLDKFKTSHFWQYSHLYKGNAYELNEDGSRGKQLGRLI